MAAKNEPRFKICSNARMWTTRMNNFDDDRHTACQYKLAPDDINQVEDGEYKKDDVNLHDHHKSLC